MKLIVLQYKEKSECEARGAAGQHMLREPVFCQVDPLCPTEGENMQAIALGL